MENITKEQLEQKIKDILAKRSKLFSEIKDHEAEVKTIQAKRNMCLLELAKLEGEERAVKDLLSTFEPPKEDEK